MTHHNLLDIKMKPTLDTALNAKAQLIDIAGTSFKQGTAFVPCVASSDEKKIPAKGVKGWQKGDITLDKLHDYKFDMLALVLGDEYLAIDKDGVSAIKKFLTLEFNLPDTLTVSSVPGEREALIFSLPHQYKGLISPFSQRTGEKEQLEFRTGGQYQVIAGIHPKTRKPYYSNDLEIAELPGYVADWLIQVNNNLKTTGTLTGETELEDDNVINSNNAIGNGIMPAPLSIYCDRHTRQLVKTGVPAIEGRNNSCFAAACDLIGTAEALEELGIEYEGTAFDTFKGIYDLIDQDDFAEKEFLKCWDSASNKERGTYKDIEILKEISGYWVLEYDAKKSTTAIEEAVLESSGVDCKAEKLDVAILKAKRANAVMNHFEAWELATRLYKNIYGYGVSGTPDNNVVVRQIYTRLGEEEKTPSSRENLLKMLGTVQTGKQLTLDNERFIQLFKTDSDGVVHNDDTAIDAVEHRCKKKGYGFELGLIPFITAISSLLPKKLKFYFNDDGETTPNIFSLVVGQASAGKDSVTNPFINPLAQLSTKENNEAKDRHELSKKVLQDWLSLSKPDRDSLIMHEADLKGFDLTQMTPSEKRNLYFELNNAEEDVLAPHPYVLHTTTFEGLTDKASKHKDYGLLLGINEISEIARTFNKVSGNSDGLKSLIRAWDGQSTAHNTKGGDEFTYQDYYRVSMLSGIQTRRLQQFLDTKEDDSGIASRILYVHLKDKIKHPGELFPTEKEAQFNYENLYKSFQERIYNQVPEVTEMFGDVERVVKQDLEVKATSWSDHKVFTTWMEYCNKIADQLNGINTGGEQWYRRLAENTAKISLNIHLLRFYYGYEKSASRISAISHELAIMIAKILEAHYCSLTETLPGAKLEEEEVFLFSDVMDALKRYCTSNKSFAVSAKDLNGSALSRKKAPLSRWGNKGAKSLKRANIYSMFKELEFNGLGTLDKVTGEFTPDFSIFS